MSSITPLSISADDEVYVLTYRDGIQSLPVFGFVKFSTATPVREVVEKCQIYCRRHHYRYVSVRPWLIDVLEKEDSGEVILREGPQEEKRDGSINNNNNSSSRNSNRSVNQANVETVKS